MFVARAALKRAGLPPLNRKAIRAGAGLFRETGHDIEPGGEERSGEADAIFLGAIGLPAEAIGLILVTDRVLDMCRTAVNVWGDSVVTVVLARSEGEEQVLSLPVSEMETVTTTAGHADRDATASEQS